MPEAAWLEGLVNAVVHRSYSSVGGHVRIEIFDDRIEIWSPGRFLGLVDPARSGVARLARNPQIARACAELRLCERPGAGISWMAEQMRAAGLGDPVYEQGSSTVRLSLFGEGVNDAIAAALSLRGRAILSLLTQADRLSTGAIAEALGESRPVAQRELRALRDAGAVTWAGKSTRDPHAYWARAQSTSASRRE